MRRNFEFDGMTVVRWEGRPIDLHNAYDLDSFGTDRCASEAVLRFSRNRHALDPVNLPPTVTLTCSGNIRIAFNDLAALAAPVADEGIEIAYFDRGCDWDSFLDEDLARRQRPLGLHVSFNNGFAVRIFCDEARFAAS